MNVKLEFVQRLASLMCVSCLVMSDSLQPHRQEKAMATHSSVFAWRIPGMGEPGGLCVFGVAQSWT